MPNPTVYDVHVNTPLSNLSIAYIQDASVFVASKVFPNIPSDKRSDLYYTYSQADFFRAEMQERAPGVESAGGGYRLSTSSYFCRLFALHDDVSDQVRMNSDTVLKPDSDAVSYLTQQALLKREIDWAAAYFKAGVWATTCVGQTGASSMPSASQFWNLSTSTPIEDIRFAQKTVHSTTGYKPKTGVAGASCWSALQDNQDLLDRIKFSGGISNLTPAQVTTQMVAQVLGLDDLYIMEAVQNTAKEGQAFSGAFIGDKAFLLVYAAKSAGLKTVSAGYTFSWTGQFGSGPEGARIKKFRMEPLSSDRIEIEMAYALQMVSNALGFFFSAIVQ
jgi:hypothetical protein